MAKRSVGSLFIDIEARTARLEADLGKARAMLTRMNSHLMSMSKGFQATFGLAKAAVAAFASVAVLKSLEKMTMGTLENVRAQMQLAEATSLTVNDLTAFSEASEHLGVTNLNLTKTMKELFTLQSDVRSGNKDATKVIRQMGMSVEEFGRLKPGELFETVVDKMGRITDASQRAALSQKIFGKEATNLASLLSRGGSAIKEAREEMVRLNQTVTEFDTARVTVAMTAVAELDDRWEVFKKRLAIGLTPLIYAVSTRLADFIGSIDVDKLANTISTVATTIAGFILTIPARLKLMLKEVQLIWYNFISQFDTGDADGFLAKIFGTQGSNNAKVQEIKKQIAELEGSIAKTTLTMETEFGAKVAAILNQIAKLPPVVSSVNNQISSGTKEMVETFSGQFQNLADISSQFLDGESVKFGDWFRTLIKMMISTFLKVSLLNPMLNAVFGGMMGGTGAGWWSALPSMFGGGKASGGPVAAGSTHLVGENGPEVVSFGSAAYVTPNDRLQAAGGGMTVNVSQYFQTGMTQREFASAVPTIIQQTKAAVADGAMRGGGYSRAVRG